MTHVVSFDHLIGAEHEPGWNFMPDLLRSVEIDDNLEFGRLLDRPIGGLRAPQYPIDITSPPAGMC
jgi:hypothetical protein